MPSLRVNGWVQLVRDVPRHDLHRGDRGVVQSTWFAPSEAYEVEFLVAGEAFPVRAIVLPDQVAPEPEDRAPLGRDGARTG